MRLPFLSLTTRSLSGTLALFLLLFSGTVSAQCLPLPPADVTCMSGTTVASNSNINSGTYVHCGSTGNFSNVNMNGGTLQVCGVGSMSSINFNSGTIHISQYAQLTINGGLTLNNNCVIVNYGTLIVNGNIQFQNVNNYIYNARSDAKIIVSGNISFPSNTNQSSYLLNKGYITANTVTLTDGVTRFCMESGSYLGVSTFTMNVNNISNPVTYGSVSGSAVIRYTTSSSMSGSGKSLTVSSGITICRATGASAVSGSGNIGAATLTTGCAATAQPTQTGVVTTCYTLPVEWLSFEGQYTAAGVVLNWATASETNNDYFEVQRAGADGEYVTIAQIDGAGNSSQINRYAYTWSSPAEGDNYFRIKQVDFNGEFDYSHPVYVHVGAHNEVDYSLSSLFNEDIRVQINTPQTALYLTLYNEMGQQVLQSPLQEGSNTIGTEWLAPGTYIAVLSNSQGETIARNLVLKAL